MAFNRLWEFEAKILNFPIEIDDSDKWLEEMISQISFLIESVTNCQLVIELQILRFKNIISK